MEWIVARRREVYKRSTLVLVMASSMFSCSSGETNIVPDIAIPASSDLGVTNDFAVLGDAAAPIDASIATDSGMPSAYVGTIMQAAPEAWWRFEESSGTTISDSTGHGHDATASGSLAYNQTGLINAGASLAFAGGDVELPYNAALNPSGSFSVEAWFNWDGGSPSDYQGIIGSVSLSGAFSAGYTLTLAPSSPSSIYFGLEAGQHAATLVTTSVASFSANQTHYVVATYDAAAQMAYVYLDGQLSVSSPVNMAFVANTTDKLTIGSTYDTRRFHGRLDEVAMYTRALSAAEVLAHYGAGHR